MRRRPARMLVAAGTIAVALGLAVPPAMAAGTWTVTGGTNFTMAFAPGTTFTLSDTTVGISFTCTAGTGAGTVINETSGTDTAIGSISNSTLGNAAHKCNGPIETTFTAAQKSGDVETLNAVSYNSATKIATGTITNIDLLLTINFLSTCAAEIKGTAGVTYDNTNSLLQFITAGDALEITSTSGGCAGLIATGDVVTFKSGTGGESIAGNPLNPITIEQP